MPQVPYQGAPSVSPTDAPIPYRSTSVPPGAFGADVAQAVQGLGRATESAGTEVFQRGYAMQVLNQKAAASEAVAKFSDEAGQHYADYLTTEGNNAVQGYKPFQDQIAKTREQFRQGLTSPLAQQEFDQETRSMQSRFSMSGATHAAEQNKVYVLGASKARVEAASQEMAQNPDDPAATEANLAKIKEEVGHQADVMGVSPEAREGAIKKAVSDKLATQLQAQAKINPIAAQKRLDELSKSGEILPLDATSTAGAIQSQLTTVGARTIAGNTMAGNNGKWGEGPIDINRAAELINKVENNTGDPSLIHPATKKGDHALGNYGIMDFNLQPWLKKWSMAPMTEQQFLNDPAVQKQLFTYEFGSYMKKYGSFNAAADHWLGMGPDDGSVNHAEYHNRLNKAWASTASLQEITDATKANAEAAAPGNVVLADSSVAHVETLHNQQARITRDTQQQNYETINGALSGSTMPDGKVPTNLNEVIADPKFEQAYMGLSRSEQNRVQNILANNARGDVAWDPEGKRQAVYNNLIGLAKTNPDAFMNTDIMNVQIPMKYRQELLQMQHQVYAKEDPAPQVTKALRVLAPSLEAAGVKDDKENYNQFLGSLHDTIAEKLKENGGKALTEDDYKQIGAGLLQSVTVPGKMWGTTEVPLYQAPLPDDEDMRKIKADPAWAQRGIVPTDAMLHSAYVAKQYMNMYQKKAAAQKPAATPEVPRGR